MSYLWKKILFLSFYFLSPRYFRFLFRCFSLQFLSFIPFMLTKFFLILVSHKYSSIFFLVLSVWLTIGFWMKREMVRILHMHCCFWLMVSRQTSLIYLSAPNPPQAGCSPRIFLNAAVALATTSQSWNMRLYLFAISTEEQILWYWQ